MPEKRLRAKVTVGHDSNGFPIHKWASGKTKKELEAAKDELLKTYVNGAKVQRDITFGQFTVEWYNAYKKPNISAASRLNYKSTLNGKLLPTFGNRQLRAITAIQLQEYVNGFSGYGSTTICYIMSILKNIFSMAFAQGVIDRDPTASLKRPPTAKESRRALTDAEVSATLSVIDDSTSGLLLALLYYTGIRRGEALGLKWSDVDFRHETISIERDVDFATGEIGKCKTSCSVRIVPAPRPLLDLLQRNRGIGYIITAPKNNGYWSRAIYVKRWRAIQEKLVEADGTIEQENGRSIITAHYYRHNYASVLYNAGVDVMSAQKFLGHSKPETTMRIYTHLGEKIQLRDAERVKSIFSV